MARIKHAKEQEYRDQLIDWLLENETHANVTLCYLAQQLGISRPTLYKFMYTEKPVSLKTLAIIRSFLKSRYHILDMQGTKHEKNK